MKRFLPFLAGLAVLIGLLLAAAAIAVHVYLTPEKARALIATQLSQRLHREVKLGSVSVGLFTGLRVTDFALSERPTFQQGTFVSSDELRVRLSLPPLLARRIVVSDVRLVKPSVRVVRFADGKFNFSDLSGAAASGATSATSPSSAAPAAPSKGGTSFPVVVTGVSLKRGRLAFEDRAPGGRSVTIDPLDASLRNLSLSGAGDVDAALGIQTNGVTADLAFAGVVNALTGSAKIRRCEITSGASKMSLSGDLRDLTTSPGFNVTLDVPHLDLPLVAKLLPDAAAYQPSGAVKANLKLNGTLSGFIFETSADLGGAGFAAPGGFSKPRDKAMTIGGNGKLQRLSALTLDRLALTLGEMQATVSGRADSILSSTRTFSLSVRTNAFPVSEALARLPNDTLPADLALGGDAAVTVKATGDANAGELDLSLDGAGLTVRQGTSFNKGVGVPLSVHGTGRYALPLAVDFRRLEVTLASLKLDGAASYRGGDKSVWSATLKGGAFAVGPVAALAPAAAAYAPTGTATIDVDARGGGTAKTTAKGAFTLRDGAARYEASTLSSLAADGTFTMDSVNVPSLRGKLNGGDLSMSLSAKNVGVHPVIVADVNAAELDLDKLLPKTPPPPKTGWVPSLWPVAVAEADMTDLPMDISGTLKAARIKHPYFDGSNLDLTWKLTNVTPSLDKVSGTAKLRHGKGEIRNLQKLTADSRAARLLFAPLAAVQKLGKATAGAVKIPPLDQLPFSSITGDYSMREGVMTITTFLLKASGLDASLTGTMKLFGDQTVDAKGVATVSNVELPFTIKGPLATASPSFNIAKGVENVIKSGAADKYLKQWGLPTFGKPKSPPAAPSDQAAPATQAAPTEKQLTPQDAAQELLKGLFKKRK